jgi:hypothetical protein
MQPLGDSVADWEWEDGVVLPSIEDGAWWEPSCSTVLPAWSADDGENENWLYPIIGENDNSRVRVVRVKITMTTDAEVAVMEWRRQW